MMTISAFGIVLLLGFVGGSLNGLANQAATSEDPKMASVYAMRTFLVSMQIMPLILLFLWNLPSALRIILPKADPEVLYIASSYAKVGSLALPPCAFAECIRRYCQAFGKVSGPALGYTFAARFAVTINYFLIHGPLAQLPTPHQEHC